MAGAEDEKSGVSESQPQCWKKGPWTDWRVPFALRIACVLVAYMTGLFTFVMFVFNIYALPVQQRFLLSQTQLELLFSLSYFGFIAASPGGLIIQRFGIRVGTLLASLVTVLSYILLTLASNHPHFFQDNFWLLASFFFIQGCGSGLTITATNTAVLQNFEQENRGKMQGFFFTSNSLGPLITIAIYNKFFINGHPDDPGLQNLAGFFSFLTIVHVVCGVLGVVFYDQYYIPRDALILQGGTKGRDTEKAPLMAGGKVQDGVELSGVEGDKSVVDREEGGSYDSLLSLLKSPIFHIYFWSTFILDGYEALNVDNLTTYLESLGLEQYYYVLPYINPVVSITAKAGSGLLADVVGKYRPAETITLVTVILNIVMWLLSMFRLDQVGVLIFNQVMCDICSTAHYIILPALLVREFKIKNISRNIGLMTFAWGCGSFVFQMMFGVIYDSRLDAGQTTCYGLGCFRLIFGLAVILNIVVALGFLYIIVKRWNVCKRQIK